MLTNNEIEEMINLNNYPFPDDFFTPLPKLPPFGVFFNYTPAISMTYMVSFPEYSEIRTKKVVKVGFGLNIIYKIHS